MDFQTQRNAAISGLIWKLLERGGYAFVQVAIQIVLARLLAPEDFGVLAIMLVFINIANVFVQSGLNTALIQRDDLKDNDCDTVFTMNFCISVILFALIYIFSPSVAEFYQSDSLIWPFRVLGAIVLINSVNAVQNALVTRDLKMRKAFIATLASVIVSGVSGILFALGGGGIWALVVQQLLYQIVNCLCLFLLISWRPGFNFDPDRARVLFSFGSKLLASGLLEQLYQGLADLIIGRQFSSSSLGLVSQGKKYPAAIGGMLDGAIQPVMLSTVSRVQSDVEKVKRIVRRALKTSTYLIFPTMTLFACIAPSIVPSLLGEQWRDSIPYLQVYCFVYALLPVHTTNLQALNGMGRSDLFLRLEYVKKGYGLASLLFCAFILKDVWLLVLSYLFTGILSTFVNALPSRQVIHYSYLEQLVDIGPAILLSALSGFGACFVSTMPLNSALLPMIQMLVFIFIYIGGSALVRLEEFEYLTSVGKTVVLTKSRK